MVAANQVVEALVAAGSGVGASAAAATAAAALEVVAMAGYLVAEAAEAAHQLVLMAGVWAVGGMAAGFPEEAPRVEVDSEAAALAEAAREEVAAEMAPAAVAADLLEIGVRSAADGRASAAALLGAVAAAVGAATEVATGRQ